MTNDFTIRQAAVGKSGPPVYAERDRFWAALFLEKKMTTAHALRASEAVAKSREQLRDEHRVRLVNSAEEGVPLHSLPAGVYGFTYAPASHEAGLFAKASYLSFEIHKTSSQGTQIVGFVTEQEAGNLDYAVDCELFP